MLFATTPEAGQIGAWPASSRAVESRLRLSRPLQKLPPGNLARCHGAGLERWRIAPLRFEFCTTAVPPARPIDSAALRRISHVRTRLIPDAQSLKDFHASSTNARGVRYF